MRLKLTTSLDVSGVEVDHLALFGHWLAYSRATTDGPDPDVNQVVVVDLATSTTRTVARTRWPHGQTDWVEGTGNWIFWTDQQQEGSDAIVDIPWKIYGEDLATGTRVKIAQSEFASPPPVPIPPGRERAPRLDGPVRRRKDRLRHQDLRRRDVSIQGCA